MIIVKMDEEGDLLPDSFGLRPACACFWPVAVFAVGAEDPVRRTRPSGPHVPHRQTIRRRRA